jgi:hypothetical protein
MSRLSGTMKLKRFAATQTRKKQRAAEEMLREVKTSGDACGFVLKERGDIRRDVYKDEYFGKQKGSIYLPKGNLKIPVLKSVARNGKYKDIVLARGAIIHYEYSVSEELNEKLDAYIGKQVHFHFVDEIFRDFDAGLYTLHASDRPREWLLVRV